MPTALLADDEPVLLEHLYRRLAVFWPDLQIVATANNGIDALALLQQHQPDFAFLDIRMPGLSGLQVAEHLARTRVVFVTAYDEYAIAAFAQAAADYLLKPLADDRLLTCISRLRQQPAVSPALIQQCLNQLCQPSATLQWFHIGIGNRTRLVHVNEVIYFQAADKYTELITALEQHLIRTPLKELIRQLDAHQFAQVHRGYIVRLQAIDHIEKDMFGRQLIHLRDHPSVLPLSRSYANQFKQM